MKDQIKIQTTSGKINEGGVFIGDKLQQQGNAAPVSFKTIGNVKRTMPAAMQKKINPRLLIL
ncbi:hypothetical protein HDF26_000719 [Pedobacter cryoconitis]|uniref:Uncharacterized protein n=1 Tax=Pedobacter cryoconitis TaxID=188932 RepID=A0A7W8ZQ33_9SPHI|nr:hypothetical protein [Pedobacter cryoconitis]MBB5637950.1 hypothetical protein [Pedobacter cryoconitis]MBB6270292.1 hypothetical protein [Pedobacter cryoconitis]